MKCQNFFMVLLVTLLFLSLSSCTDTKPLKTLEADEITTIGKNCDELFRNHIDAWDSRDPENLRMVYTDDIVHFDGMPLYEGIDSVIDMAGFMFDIFPDWNMEAGATYISKDECVGTWINWGVLGLQKDNPGLEFDLLQTRDGKIYFWQVFYTRDFFEALDESTDQLNLEFLSQFAAAWSGGDSDELVKLYSQDAELEDTLFETSATSKKAIQKYANSFFAKSTGTWNLLVPFAESQPGFIYKMQYPIQSQGGVFSVQVQDAKGKPCEIEVFVILLLDADGYIQSQQNFYNVDSLLTCGWAN